MWLLACADDKRRVNGARSTRRSRGVSVWRQIIIRKSKSPLYLFSLITRKMADTRLPSPPAIRCGLFPVLQGDPTGFHQPPVELESGTLAQVSDSINRHLPPLFICQDGGSQVGEYFSSGRGWLWYRVSRISIEALYQDDWL